LWLQLTIQLCLGSEVESAGVASVSLMATTMATDGSMSGNEAELYADLTKGTSVAVRETKTRGKALFTERKFLANEVIFKG
jgi:hypothetical protein